MTSTKDMPPETTSAGSVQPCEPEWIALNHLFRYCAKSLSAGAPAQQAQDESGATDPRRCKRSNCVFSMRRK